MKEKIIEAMAKALYDNSNFAECYCKEKATIMLQALLGQLPEPPLGENREDYENYTSICQSAYDELLAMKEQRVKGD